MNFVVFSFNFPPKGDPESFCTARFVSALAESGHSVRVVTVQTNLVMDKATYDCVVHPAVCVTRVRSKNSKRPILSRFRYQTRCWESADFPEVIRVLKNVLRGTEDAILVSRAMPEASNIVAWHCRKFAKKWVAHFSDPCPWFSSAKSFSGKMWKAFGFRWGRRVIRDCDMVSLTCEQARRFFSENYGALFDKKTVVVNFHIGEPALPNSASVRRDWDVPCIVHAGTLYEGRGGPEIVQAVQRLNAAGKSCVLKQIGPMDGSTRRRIESSAHVQVIEKSDAGASSAIARIADACYVADYDAGIGYSPFLPSKFVYQLFTDTPLVVYTFSGSCMDLFSKAYPQAGLFVAYIGDLDSLTKALSAAFDVSRAEIKREKIRLCFTRRWVVENFIRALGHL